MGALARVPAYASLKTLQMSSFVDWIAYFDRRKHVCITCVAVYVNSATICCAAVL